MLHPQEAILVEKHDDGTTHPTKLMAELANDTNRPTDRLTRAEMAETLLLQLDRQRRALQAGEAP